MATIQKLHSILRKAGLKRSERYTTAIRGWYNYSDGYYLASYGDGVVKCRFRDGDHYQSNAAMERRYLDTAMKAFTEAGIAFEHKIGVFEELIIKLA